MFVLLKPVFAIKCLLVGLIDMHLSLKMSRKFYLHLCEGVLELAYTGKALNTIIKLSCETDKFFKIFYSIFFNIPN